MLAPALQDSQIQTEIKNQVFGRVFLSGITLSTLTQGAHLSHAVVTHCHKHPDKFAAAGLSALCTQGLVFSSLVEIQNVLSWGDVVTSETKAAQCLGLLKEHRTG